MGAAQLAVCPAPRPVHRRSGILSGRLTQPFAPDARSDAGLMALSLLAWWAGQAGVSAVSWGASYIVAAFATLYMTARYILKKI